MVRFFLKNKTNNGQMKKTQDKQWPDEKEQDKQWPDEKKTNKWS